MDKPVLSRPDVIIGMLGPLRMSADVIVSLPKTRKARALIAVLATEDRPVGRERLADLLWSGRGAEQARSSLRQVLFEVRHSNPYFGQMILDQGGNLSLDHALAQSDLQVIQHAAATDDWAALIGLLSSCGTELLDDLNGIDPQFDEWLRDRRAIEPAKTLATVTLSGERCLQRGHPQWAAAIASEIMRLDPAAEDATRLYMQAAQQMGNRAAVVRSYQNLSDTLRHEYDTLPSLATQQLFRDLGNDGSFPCGDVADEMNAPTINADRSAGPDPSAIQSRLSAAFIGVGSLAALALIVMGDRSSVATPELPLIAVVPFETASAADAGLAEGLWDDTRVALSRGGVARVLGRTTSQVYARDQLAPSDYRRKLDVDFLLDGAVQRTADQVRVTVSLIRAADGVAVWEHRFQGRLGDAFALQGAIAHGIEGRIRGRLADGGGARAAQIPTTPEVYDLYIRSQALLKKRSAPAALEAGRLLDEAISSDPNFAPALALSASALYFSRFSRTATSDWRAVAKARAERAIELAPRLAEAHAVLALVGGLHSGSAVRRLERATTFDPGDSQAWLWLGNARSSLGDFEGATAAYSTAVEIDPFLTPALINLADRLIIQQRRAELVRLIRRIERAGGGQSMAPALKAMLAYSDGRYANGIRMVIEAAKRPENDFARMQAGEGLAAIGRVDLSNRLLDISEETASAVSGAWHPHASHLDREFFLSVYRFNAVSRNAIRLGRAHEMADAYRRHFPSTEDYIATISQVDDVGYVAPNLAIVLRQSGDADAALKLLEAGERSLLLPLKKGMLDPESFVMLARIRTLLGQSKSAVALLNRANNSAWLPDGILIPADISQDPALGRLEPAQLDPVRRSLLDHAARERRLLGPLRLN